ncbi:GHKL domain-containing protein (plasmid) [Paraclostridium ghonii]|uniref:sensor histidine kinase n=1 Tax=Paraclostridium ghonii TaxID=29358 RepID=UPI00202CCA2B|nr:sensor histidine kinase [Paeniclostridium ghonii]MCM0165112.1 GHKL domain-containing protein [Paeniclostridium ghonii]
MLERIGINLGDFTNIITLYIDWIIFFTLLTIIGTKKISNRKYLFRVILITVFMVIISIFNIFPNTKTIIYIITGTLFYKLAYKDSIYKCIIINFIFWLTLIIIESVSINIVVMYNNLDSIYTLINEPILKVKTILLSKILLLTCFTILKYFRLSLEFEQKDLALVGIPILSNIVIILVVFEHDFNQNIFKFVLIIILMIVSRKISLITISNILQCDKLKLENELVNERIKTNSKSYENINEIHNKLRYVYHDLKNHIICIKNFNTKEEIISYINNLELQISDFENFRNTGNGTLDIILGEKTSIFKKHNIEFEDNINISKLKCIQDTDICAIFANALDNAIEACLKIDNEIEKRIEVKATYINGFAIIKFTNTKVNEIKFNDEHIQTNKCNKKMHGIGISSIKYIASKYNGEVIINYSDNEFILKIMIPIKDLP